MASNIGVSKDVLVSLDNFEDDFNNLIEVLDEEDYINKFSHKLCVDASLLV